MAVATLPGTRLFHEGQFEGRKVRLPVFLSRRPDEPTDFALSEFYEALFAAVNRHVFREVSGACATERVGQINPSFANFGSLYLLSRVSVDTDPLELCGIFSNLRPKPKGKRSSPDERPQKDPPGENRAGWRGSPKLQTLKRRVSAPGTLSRSTFPNPIF